MRVYIIGMLMIMFVSTVYSQAPEDDHQMMNPALLVIDVQNRYVPMMSEADRERALMLMNYAIYVFRSKDLPVIRVYHTSEEWGPEPGTPEFEFDSSLMVKDSDPMVIKTYGSAFTKTELDNILKEKEINTLFMCGLSSVGCVLATYMDAENYDYRAFLVKNGLLSHNDEYTDQIEEIFNALSLDTIDFMLDLAK